IQTGAFVKIGFWPFIAKNILPVISTERAGVFPLRIDCSIAFANGDPSILAGGNGWALVCFVEPGNNTRRFGPMALSRFVIIGKRAVKWVLPRREFYRDVIAATSGIRIVEPAIIFGPFFVPGAYPIGNRIVTTRFLADPKDGCHDVCFPRIALSRLRPSCRQQLPRRERD